MLKGRSSWQRFVDAGGNNLGLVAEPQNMTGQIKLKLMFDTFVSYHESDKNWVTENLIQHLEDQHIIVCWDDRDFEPGRTVIENKLSSLCSSACTIIVLSPEYVEHENLWSVLQEKCGVDRCQLLNELNLIPVLFRPCKVPELFQTLWKLDWTNKSVKKFFWEKLTKTVRNFTHEFSVPAETNGSSEDSGVFFQKEPEFSDDSEANEFDEHENSFHKQKPKSPEEILVVEKNPCDEKQMPTSNFPMNTNTNECIKDSIPKKRSNICQSKEMSDQCEKSMTIQQSGSFDENFQTNIPGDELNNSKQILIKTINDSENQLAESLGEENNFLENMNPRILSFFVPEDDDLTREDIEELTFKIENVNLGDHQPSFEDDFDEEKSYKVPLANPASKRKKRNLDTFQSQQEQILILDFLQEKYLKIKRKFESCLVCDRKRIYRRLLERFDEAICSTVNGEKDSLLLASLPISELQKWKIDAAAFEDWFCVCEYLAIFAFGNN
eukprot:gene5330-500_t